MTEANIINQDLVEVFGIQSKWGKVKNRCTCVENPPLSWDNKVYKVKQQNTGPLIYISLNHKGAYSVVLRSSKDFDTCKTGGSKWPCIL